MNREEFARLELVRDTLGWQGCEDTEVAASYVGSALASTEELADGLTSAVVDTVLDFIGEYVLMDGLAPEKHGILAEWIADTIDRDEGIGNILHHLREAVSSIETASAELTTAVANIEREMWLAEVGAL